MARAAWEMWIVVGRLLEETEGGDDAEESGDSPATPADKNR